MCYWILSALLGIGFFVRSFLYVYKNSSPIIFWDQWDYLPKLAWQDSPAFLDIFTQQFGPHRMGLGFVMSTYLGHWSGFDIRLESILSFFLFVLCGLLALGLKYRITKSLNPLDIFLFVLPLNLAQAEIFVAHSSFYMGSVPQLLILSMAHILIGGLHRVKNCVLLLGLNVLSIFSAFAFFAGLVTPLTFLCLLLQEPLRNKKIVFFFSFIVSLATLYWFFQGYKFTASVSCFHFPHSKPWEYPVYSAFMYGRFIFEGSKGLPLIMGSVTLLSLGWFGLRTLLDVFKTKEASQNPRSALLFLYLYTALYIGATAIGRVCLGPAQGSSSRYIPYIVPSLIALWISISLLNIRHKRYILAGILSIFMVSELYWRQRDMNNTFKSYIDGKRAWASCYLNNPNIKYCNKVTGFFVYPPVNEDKFKEKLDLLQRKKWSIFKERDINAD